MKKILPYIIFLFIGGATLFAQPSQTLYTVIVEPDKSDWTYQVGEAAEFRIYVLKDKTPLNNITIQCEYGPEMLPSIHKTTLDIRNSEAKLKVPGMKTPGFQTVRATYQVGGKTYSSYTNIAYEPEKIKPTTTLPDDFTLFWEKAKNEAAQTPLEPFLTLQPDLCTPTLNVYHVRFQNNAPGSYIYGMLCIPKKPGKYPAVLQLPGAGLHSFTGYKSLADHGVITLEIGIHGIPVNLPQEVYHNLASGALSGYSSMNMNDKDKYYFKRVFTGCIRAIDFLYTLDPFDKENLATMGGSQGGALSIITAALDKRVKCFTARHPGMCDITGYISGRAGGSPGLKDPKELNIREKLETSRYYDVVNFCRFIQVPGCLTWGYNDTACPPTTMYSAYNTIPARKELKLYRETAHWHFQEQMESVEEWVLQQLGVIK